MSRDEPLPHPGFRLTGRHVLAIVTLFFAIILSADIGMSVMAYRTFSGQVARDPYEAGLLYNRILDQRRAEQALGWIADIGRDRDGGVLVTLTDRSGAPLSGLTVSVTLERPATEAGSMSLRAEPVSPGVYKARASAPLTGAWDVRARAVDKQGHAFEAERRLSAP